MIVASSEMVKNKTSEKITLHSGKVYLWNEKNKEKTNMEYIKTQSTEELILEPEDYTEDEWNAILKIFNMKEADRMVISDYTFEAYGEVNEDD